MLQDILVGYAGDAAGREGVALAGALASAVEGRLTVVFPYHPLLARADSEEIQERVAGEVAELLASQSDLPQPTFRWTSTPWPIHALHELARYEQSDLIVLGAARHGLADHLHVSLMERLVHGAPCAVAIAPDGYSARPLRELGVGFAGSPEGRAAIELARELASRTGGRLRVIAGAGLEPALASYAFSSPALEDVEEELYRQTLAELERFCEEYRGPVPVASETVRGDPASVLIERSSELDLLVLGSRAYGPLRHVLLGSVSARAMREARCPVLVVPRDVANEDEHDRPQRADAVSHG